MTTQYHTLSAEQIQILIDTPVHVWHDGCDFDQITEVYKKEGYAAAHALCSRMDDLVKDLIKPNFYPYANADWKEALEEVMAEQ